MKYIDTDIDGSEYYYHNGQIVDKQKRPYGEEEQSNIALSYKGTLKEMGIDPAHLFLYPCYD